jgi:hypothetical protein
VSYSLVSVSNDVVALLETIEEIRHSLVIQVDLITINLGDSKSQTANLTFSLLLEFR